MATLRVPGSVGVHHQHQQQYHHSSSATTLQEGDKLTARLHFKPLFFLEMTTYHVLAFVGVGVMAQTRGWTFAHNTILSDRGETLFGSTVFVLVLLIDLAYGLVLPSDGRSFRATTDMMLIHVLWVVYCMVVACRFAFLSPQEQRELMEVRVSQGNEVAPSLSAWLRPSLRSIRAQIRLAETQLEIDTRRLRLTVNASVLHTIHTWSEPSSHALPDPGPNSDEPTHSVSVTAALVALCRIAASNTTYNPRKIWLQALAISVANTAVASACRAAFGSWEAQQPFGTSGVAPVLMVLVVVVLVALSSRLYADLLTGESVYALKSHTRASLRDVFQLDQVDPPACSLERENLIAFLELCKVLRRLGGHPTMHAHAVMTGFIFLWLALLLWMVVALLRIGALPFEFVVVQVCTTISLTFCLIKIIVKGADANSQHDTTKQLLLELRLAADSPDLATVVGVLDHLDNADAVRVFGVQCSRALVNSIFAFFFSAVTVYLRLAPG